MQSGPQQVHSPVILRSKKKRFSACVFVLAHQLTGQNAPEPDAIVSLGETLDSFGKCPFWDLDGSRFHESDGGQAGIFQPQGFIFCFPLSAQLALAARRNVIEGWIHVAKVYPSCY